MSTAPILTIYTDKQLEEELARRKKDRVYKERAEREQRSIFLLGCIDELLALMVHQRPQDSDLHKFLLEAKRDQFWDWDYDVELRLVRYPQLED